MTKCKYENCSKYCIYGLRDSNNAEYCKEHSPPGYVDVVNKTCLDPNCEKQPTYGKKGSKKAEYCKEHSPPGYVNVKSKTCLDPNCEKQPNYGKKGSKKAEYCKEHSPPGYVDVKSKTCLDPNCETRPSYNFPGYSPEYCKKHSQKRMVIYPLKKPKDEDIVCQYCSTVIHYNEQFCSSCKKYIELGNKTVKAERKELEIKCLLEENEIKFIHDTVVSGACSKRRPDFLIPTRWGHIVLETDEHQHNRKTYSCECEITRMKQIYQDVGEQNMLFVRYNPDSYKCVSGKPYDKLKRQEYLVKYINGMINTDYSGLGVVYLFYDYFTENVEIERIDYM